MNVKKERNKHRIIKNNEEGLEQRECNATLNPNKLVMQKLF